MPSILTFFSDVEKTSSSQKRIYLSEIDRTAAENDRGQEETIETSDRWYLSPSNSSDTKRIVALAFLENRKIPTDLRDEALKLQQQGDWDDAGGEGAFSFKTKLRRDENGLELKNDFRHCFGGR